MAFRKKPQNKKDEGFQTPQGDLFVWKYLAIQRVHTETSGNPGDFLSPVQHGVWESGKLTAKIKVKDDNSSGIYGYWTFDELLHHEIHYVATAGGHVDFFAFARCRIWGTVSFGRMGARAEHAQIVEAAVSSDAYALVTEAHPGLEVRHMKFPFRYSFPEYTGRSIQEECMRMGFEIPPPVPPAQVVEYGAAPSYSSYTSPATPSLYTPGMGRNLANFRYGMYANPGPFVGRTIAEVRQHLDTLWQVPADAMAFKGKQPLPDHYVVQDGDNIEFHRRRI